MTLHDLVGHPIRAVGHCPVCGSDLTRPRAFVQEFWSAREQNFFCWCPDCSVVCTVTIADRVVGHEPEH